MAEINSSLADPNKVLKEVFKTDDIKVRTELNIKQIETVNKLNTLVLITGNQVLNSHINDLLMLQKSKNRGSLGELIEGIKANMTKATETIKEFKLV